MICCAWVTAVVITCPPLFGWREAGRSNISNVCTLTQDPGYVIYSALGSFYIPLVRSKKFLLFRLQPAKSKDRDVGKRSFCNFYIMTLYGRTTHNNKLTRG